MQKRIVIHSKCENQISTKKQIGQWIYCIHCKVRFKETPTRKYVRKVTIKKLTQLPMKLTILFVLGISFIGLAEAQEPEPEPTPQLLFPNQFITIEIAENCFNIISSFPDHPCPTYEEILYLDESVPIVSGQFEYNELGFLERQPSPLVKHWRYFDLENKTRIYIDPPYDMATKGQQIIITPEFGNIVSSHITAPNFSLFGNGTELYSNGFELFTNQTIAQNTVHNFTGPNIVSSDDPKITTRPGIIPDTIQYTRNTTTYYTTDRIITPDCKTAYLDASAWQKYLHLTIDYLLSDCDQSLLIYETTTPAHIPHSNIDLTTSPHYQYQLQLERILNGCLTEYSQCSTLP